MRGTERSRPYKADLGAFHPRHRVDLARDDGLLRSHRRKDSGHRLGQRTLAASRRADHDQIVSSRRRDLHTPLGTLLPDDLGEIHHILTARPFRTLDISRQFPVKPCVPDKKITAILITLKDSQHICKCLDTENRQIPALRRLQRRADREDAPGYSHLHRKVCYRQRPLHLPHRSIQAQFPHYQVPVKTRKAFLP